MRLHREVFVAGRAWGVSCPWIIITARQRENMLQGTVTFQRAVNLEKTGMPIQAKNLERDIFKESSGGARENWLRTEV